MNSVDEDYCESRGRYLPGVLGNRRGYLTSRVRKESNRHCKKITQCRRAKGKDQTN